MYTGLITGAAVLAVVMIFIIQNAHAMNAAAAGTARITQLRRTMRPDRRGPKTE